MAKTIQIAVRLTPELAELVDRFASDSTAAMRESFPGITVGRADAIRILLSDGLEKRGYDVVDARLAEESEAAGAARDNNGDGVAVDPAARRSDTKTKESTVEGDLLAGVFSQSEIARRHGCSRQHVSQVKKKMEEAGVVGQRPTRNRRAGNGARG